jgi:hypothetical protein
MLPTAAPTPLAARGPEHGTRDIARGPRPMP